MDDEKTLLLSTIREFYGRVAWTHKTHEKDREIYSKHANYAKWINVLLTSTTFVIVVASIPLNSTAATIVGTIFAFISTTFAVYRLSFSPEKEAQSHRQAAKSLLEERDHLELLIAKTMSPNSDVEEIRKDLERTAKRLAKMYSMAPDTSSQAYEAATQALNNNEELTLSTKEVDNFLPEALRLGRNSEDIRSNNDDPTSQTIQ